MQVCPGCRRFHRAYKPECPACRALMRQNAGETARMAREQRLGRRQELVDRLSDQGVLGEEMEPRRLQYGEFPDGF